MARAPAAGSANKANDAPAVPRSLDEAIERFAGSAIAREYFGDEFVDQYAHMRHWEADAFSRAVTGWERRRYFEQV